MWKILELVAEDERGNRITIEKGFGSLVVKRDSQRIQRNFFLNGTPPCLSVAVADLIKLLAKEDTT